MSRAARTSTSAVLAGVAGMHVAWGLGSSFPFRTHAELTDAVVGSNVAPSPAACNAVAILLLTASGLVADVPVAPRSVRRLGRRVVAGVLGLRGVVGLSGRTDLLSPGSVSANFRRLDRRYFAPLCLALAAGVIASEE